MRRDGVLIRTDDLRKTYVMGGEEIHAVSGIDLEIHKGEYVAIMGPSGSGKSTLMNLMLRFYDPTQGLIEVDGVDLRKIRIDDFRRQVGVVMQESYLFPGSIKDNIAYGRPGASEAEIEAAALRAQAHPFIVNLRDFNGRSGYDAHVGERGVKLSGGQRQRIAIARVILKNAPILVLDEATSSLDSEVEGAIQTSLDTLMAGKTVIAIAHRLSTIARMDRLVVIDRGRIVQQGRHDDLLAADAHFVQELLPFADFGFHERIKGVRRAARRFDALHRIALALALRE